MAKEWKRVGNDFDIGFHPVLANPPFNDSDTAPRGSALLQQRADPQVVRGEQDNFRTAMREAQDPKQGRPTCRVWGDKDDDPALRDWQWSEATWTTNGSPEGERNQAHQYRSPQRGNANFAWVQHFIHHLAPHGMAGFVLVRCWFWIKLKAARVIKSLDNPTSVSFRERRRETLGARKSIDCAGCVPTNLRSNGQSR